MISGWGSQLRRKTGYTALALASMLFLFFPQAPGARPLTDDTPPIVTYTVDGIQGDNDWFRGSSGGNFIVVHWFVSDPESQILSTTGCEPAIQIPGPNTGTTRTCSATSDGGTTTVTTRLLKIDATPPTVTAASPDRQPDHNGWYNHAVGISWSGTDATSGIASCTSRTYSTPDVANGSTSGTCTDMAGNTSAPFDFGLSYDSTPPVVSSAAAARGPDHNGWYNHAVRIDWSGTDAMSGIDSCTSRTYSAPDSANATSSGTCTDVAGNTSATALPYTFSYDSTGPTVTASANRVPDHSGWYNHSLGISWSGTDGASGMASCSQSVTYTGPDTANASVNGSCTDNAGNASSRALGFNYDDSAPTVTATPSRAANANGWYNAPLTVAWNGTDPVSGLDSSSCRSPLVYSAPDTTGTDVSGSCSDNAGNSASATFRVKYDATAPTVTGATPARPPDHNGWYNHSLPITWNGTDATSGVTSCSSSTYSGPDSAAASAPGSCTDAAGNVGTSNFGFQYDSSAPAVAATADRSADHNGWYNHSVGVSWGGTDATSGLDAASCTPAVTYNGPDRSGVSLTGSCSDNAGNSATGAISFDYDDTAPSTTATPSRASNAAGWYNAPLSISWHGSDATSGIASCRGRLDYSSPDTAGTNVNGSCTDNAGNSSTDGVLVKYDSTPPTLAAPSPGRVPDHDGWYNHPVRIDWSGTDATSGIASCSSLTYGGPDDANASPTGSCTDVAGNVATVGFPLEYDATTPTLIVAPDRAPDHGPWYNHPVGISWSGTDATSGIDSCTPAVTYNGPDTANANSSGGCTDNAGNSSTSALQFGYDHVAPNTVATPSRAPNAAGWYKAPVSIGWSATDGTSGVASCHASVTYSGPDTTGSSQAGSCTDNAGNSSPASFLVKYDTTPPATVASSNPAPNANGWFKAPVSISWGATDGTSGVASCRPSLTYSGPDTIGATQTGSCTDNAGNSSSDSFVVKYDTVAPVTAASPSRPPNGAGWFNAPLSVGWTGADGTSGIDSCSPALAYSGPDSTGTTKTGSCTDKAGNTSSDSFVVKYDATPPTVNAPSAARSPDSEGWYNHPVRVDWSGSDGTSGIASCTSRTYGGPDDANASMSGSCTDAAGNSTGRDFALQYDSTDPAVSVTPARGADHNDWYNRPVSISWSGTDATSGIASCTPQLTYSGPDSANASSVGGCTDHAGNSASPPPLAFKYDATAPVTTAVPSRPPDANGWYNHLLAINWKGSDPVSGVAACSSLSYSGPDAARLSGVGTCTDRAGNTSAPRSLSFNYDATPPRGLSVAADRTPDHEGWYNHALSLRWSGSDAPAGIASCTALTYDGPDTPTGALSGRCTDRAGNTSAPLAFALRYDQTPPEFRSVALKPLDGLVALSWRVSGADALRIARSPGMTKSAAAELYAGTGSAFADRRVENYVRYRYTLTAMDAAGNTDTRVVFATPMPTLFAPRPQASLAAHSTPLLAWRGAKGARYYNVQLWLGGQKVGSWWPTRSRLRLPARWQLKSKARRLERGRYTWYVWPGRGARRLGRYGKLLGRSTFVVH